MLRLTSKYLFVALSLLIGWSASAQYFVLDTLKLNTSYRNLVQRPDDPTTQKAFFDAFPSSWVEFANTYIQPRAFSEEHSNPNCGAYDSSMSSQFMSHFKSFQDGLNAIPDSLYCAKLINVSIGAIYDADEPNFLQDLLHQAMDKRQSAMMKVISEMTIADQLKFWLFYWASEFKETYPKEFERLYSEMVKTYPEEAATMKIGFDYASGHSSFDIYGHIDQKKFENIIN